ncbi:MAG TPA: LysM peptidoglycan-binding domain-containing protein [Candidatus Krumholzibacteria bacterium]|nr:LysM peptidoglycan-binding domain-containing protein [Candidatus Krumholzibacteria bacterium]
MPARAVVSPGPNVHGHLVRALLGIAMLCLTAPELLAQEDPDVVVHRVRSGENLSWIAQRHRVSVSDLRHWNDLRGSRILPGQELRIPRRGGEIHVVRRGDTLSGIAERHGVSVSFLRRINALPGSRIHPGQRLNLQPSRADEAVHVVRRGDTLIGIARRYGVSVSILRDLNGVVGERIHPGQKLRLRSVATSVHVVERGDALWEIARAYGMSLAELRTLNGLRGDRIHPGQELKIRESGSQAPRWATHVVRRGDTLGEIAQLHQMSLRELRSANTLRSSVIHPGQRLRVRPLLGDDDTGLGLLSPAEIPWNDLVPRSRAVPVIAADNGPYLYSEPRAGAQRSRHHREGSAHGPRATYQQARRLWDSFDARIETLGRSSRSLEGLTVILDPGHGGRDPGTIVPTRIDDSRTVHVVEDEYVYDISLRVAVLLRLHGADVHLSLLSPNHLLRSNDPATATFVNEQNEVYNSARINRRNSASSWPRGGNHGLRNRVRTIRELAATAGSNRTLLISLHADNSPRSPEAVTVFHARRDRVSRDFARDVLPAFGAGARARGYDYYVLRHAPTDLAVLVEIRNLAHAAHAWALRDVKLRQRDAEKVVKGVLDWAASGALERRVATTGR